MRGGGRVERSAALAPTRARSSRGSGPVPTGCDACSEPQCDGVAIDTCAAFLGPDVVCRAVFCALGVERVESKCDGHGVCLLVEGQSCAPYACGDTSCKTTCAATSDCADGFTCDAASGACLSGDLCDGDHTVHTSRGDEDCSPFKCSGSTCLTECSSSEACVDGTTCDTTGRTCETTNAPAASGGCAIVGARSSDDRAGLSVGALTIFAALVRSESRVRRRRRPARRATTRARRG